ncbi:MAG TPA: ATP-binding protein [Gemmatimonadales bacterium]|nr:ATP-binding protein [Gemmatimonadales bacterium]
MASQGGSHLPRWPKVLVTILGWYSVVGGLLSLLGYIIDLPRLADWGGTTIAIQPNTAVAVFATGVALLSLASARLRIATISAAVVAFIGMTALFQYLSGINLHFLNTLLLFDRTWGRTGVLSPGRMGPAGTLCWTLLGTSLLLLCRSRRRVDYAGPFFAVFTFGMALLSMTGYLYGASTLYATPSSTLMALQTATFVAAASLGVIALAPDRPPMLWLVDRGTTGSIARRTTPLIVVVPIVLGWLRLRAETAGLFDVRFGIAIQVLVFIFLLLALQAWSLATISRHESALQTSESRTAAVLSSITDGFITLDREWRYTYVNPEAARLLQRDPASLVGLRVWDLFPQSVGDDTWDYLHRAVREQQSLSYEHLNTIFNRWFSTRVYPTPDGGVAVYFQDISARKDAERQIDADLATMSRLQGLSTQLVHAGDLHALLREIMLASNELLGTTRGNIQLYNPESDALNIVVHQGFGHRFLERFAESGHAVICGRAAARQERVIIEDLEAEPELQGTPDLEILRADGIRAIQSTPLVTRDGRLLGMLNNHWSEPHQPAARELRYVDLLARMASDYVERTQSEQSLRDADRRKNEFLAMLAHELRNPLAPIGNAVEVLQRSGVDDDRVEQASGMLDRQVRQLVRLVDDLLDMSRITSGKIELRREVVELGAVINQAIEGTRWLAQSMEHELQVTLPMHPLRLRADPARLSQVVSNLLTNACKFMDRGGRIHLTVRDEGSEAVISVRDEGIGIRPSQLPLIFDLFMQADTSLERTTSGLGIGLTLVKSLVELHGGSVEARSDGAGQGSEFTIRLPGLLERGPAPLRELTGAHAGEGRGQRILVVDDNRDSAESLAMMLRLSGYDVHKVYDGLVAVEVAAKLRPDVILLDIGLPSLNGYDVCRQIRQQAGPGEALIVALTGWGQDGDKRRSAEAGFDDHLVKPVNLGVLLGLINSRVSTKA